MMIMAVFGNSTFPAVIGHDFLITCPQPHLNLAIFRIAAV
jgi:hypothetical protein